MSQSIVVFMPKFCIIMKSPDKSSGNINNAITKARNELKKEYMDNGVADDCLLDMIDMISEKLSPIDLTKGDIFTHMFNVAKDTSAQLSGKINQDTINKVYELVNKKKLN